MTVQLGTLAKLQEKQTLVDLYRDHLSNESLTGVITAFSETFVYLSLFNDSGQSNGIAIAYVSDITRVRWGGNVRDSISHLMAKEKSIPLAPKLSLASVRDVIDSVQNQFGYVNILTERMNEGVTFIGEVESIDDQSLVLNEYGTMSSRDRHHMLIGLESISRIDAEAAYEKSIRYLFFQEAGSPLD